MAGNGRRSSGWRLALVASVFVVVTVALHIAGVAGYRRGLVIVALPLVVGSAVGVAWSLGATGRTSQGRWPAVVAAGLVGLVATALLGVRSPESRGALAAQMDGLDLPFFEIAAERRSGHSWCRPTCPVVERRYDVPDVGVQATMLTIGLALAEQGSLDPEALRRIGSSPGLRATTERTTVVVEVREGDAGTVDEATIRFEARRP